MKLQSVSHSDAEVIPTAEEMIKRAQEIIPFLREKSMGCEKSGKVPEENIALLKEIGCFKILQPKVYGGYELSPAVFYRVVQEIGSGCPSTGWVLMVLGVHNWEIALMDPRAAQEVWRDDNKILISSSYVPFGNAKKTEGGYIVSGNWKFSSGCDHAQWAFLGALVFPEDGSEPDLRVFLVPRTEYEVVHDSWDVFGLKGTGSKDLSVRECFIPEHHTHSLSFKYQDSEKSAIAHNAYPNPYYKIPFYVAFYNAVASIMTGMAKGMVREFAEQMQARRNQLTGEILGTNPAAQRRLQLADAKVRQAALLIQAVVDQCEEILLAGKEIPQEVRVKMVADASTAGNLCSEASILLFRSSGGKGIYNDNKLGFFFRNIQAGANHICMDIDRTGMQAGASMLGSDGVMPIV